MPLITETTRKNADKCKNCAMMRVRSLDKDSVIKEIGASLAMDTNTSVIMDGMIKASCNTCPNAADFKKVYGVMPYDYFNPPKKK